jgi:ABC-type ATPase with predicted acetyltransferase domain
MPTYELERNAKPLIAAVDYDEITAAAIKPFDLSADDQIGFHPWVLPVLPEDFTIGVIVGASGSGKSVLLRSFGGETPVDWEPTRSIVSHFGNAEEATQRFYAVGLNAVPVWRKPYWALSNGQKFRVDLARRLGNDAVVDEFTSVVDRNVAVAASRAVRTWADRESVRRMVFATCHRDVVPWLKPDWLIDTDAGEFTVGPEQARPVWWAQHIREDRGGHVGAIGLGTVPEGAYATS